MDEKLDNGMTRVWAIWNYVEAIILVAAGVLACVFCNNDCPSAASPSSTACFAS